MISIINIQVRNTIKKGEDSDEEDLEIRATDNLIVCGTIDDDDSSLNIYGT